MKRRVRLNSSIQENPVVAENGVVKLNRRWSLSGVSESLV